MEATESTVKRSRSALDYKYFFRDREKKRATAALLSGSSIVLLGEAGIGKTVLAYAIHADLKRNQYLVAIMTPSTEKMMLLQLCNQLNIVTESLEGKAYTAAQMKEAIACFCQTNSCFLIFDNAHKLPVATRTWLSQLHDLGQPMLLTILKKLNTDVFIRAATIELGILGEKEIREVMRETAAGYGMELSAYQLASWLHRASGNPMLARRVVTEEFLGTDELEPDHTRWFNGLPLLIALAMFFTLIRFFGRKADDSTLMLIGGVLTVALAIARLLATSLERKTRGVGR